MILFPKLKNPVLNKLSDDCGLTLDFNEPAVTSKEIEFFAEQLIKDCMQIAYKSGSVANKSAQAKMEADRIYNKIKEHFGVE